MISRQQQEPQQAPPSPEQGYRFTLAQLAVLRAPEQETDAGEEQDCVGFVRGEN
ncbi:hypothetical protein [Bowmanella denitrificans]|uniref:hypothetical protein n=1 Tax=Bowmanella denitrificans TaxID=366582 RepID=UPI0015587C21|nr:hypothetical protein [Bowmanella denitrificans]